MNELLLEEDGAIGYALDDEATELQAAINELIDGVDDDFIDDIAEITDEDVEDCDFDPDYESGYYNDVDIGNDLPDVEEDDDIYYAVDNDSDHDAEDITNALNDYDDLYDPDFNEDE